MYYDPSGHDTSGNSCGNSGAQSESDGTLLNTLNEKSNTIQNTNQSVAVQCQERATEINNARGDWDRRNGTTAVMLAVDNETCQPLLEDDGLTLGGSTFGGREDKTPYRQFWR